MSYPSIIALIPARGGSKRIPRKNIRPLGGVPLVDWTIRAAEDAGIFSGIYVSTEDGDIGEHVVNTWRCCTPVIRSVEAAADNAPDFLWVKEFFDMQKPSANAFAILRPTSPFRTGDTIRRAWEAFKRNEVHSLRAVEPVKQHPGKMWQWEGNGAPIRPLIDGPWPISHGLSLNPPGSAPWHSMPTQLLPQVYIQNASLEIAWSYVIQAFGTISGTKVLPFFTEGYEGFDLNTEEDWKEAERIASTIGLAHA